MGIHFKQWLDRFLGVILILPNLVLARLWGLLLKRDHSLKNAPENILVVKILGLGSLVMAADAIAALKERYPQANFILLCNKNLVDGIWPTGIFDEYWALDDRSFLTLALSAFKALTTSWRLKKLWTVDLEIYSKLTTVFTLWTLAVNRFGFQLKTTHFRNFLNTHNEYFNHFCSVEENYRHLVKRMGIPPEKRFKFPGLEPEKRENEEGKPFIAINNTCSELALVRKLPEAQLKAICKWILTQTGYQIAFCGAPGDYEENQHFIDQHLMNNEGRIVNLAGKYRIGEFYQFLHSECAFMISVDSAPLHIARKLGLPTLSVWGPTNPLNYMDIPEAETHRHLYHYLGVHCSPCIHHTLVLPCGGDNFCMKDMDTNHLTSLTQQMIHQLKTPVHVHREA